MLNDTQLARIDLNLLVLFATVFRERHVARAAERLALTPSAVSHGLRRLRALLNDPLFLRTPRGVVPSERAMQLAPAIDDILGRVTHVIGGSTPFDPRTSQRRFLLGMPDGIADVLTPALVAATEREAPGIDLAMRQLLPPGDVRDETAAWHFALQQLETRACDVAVLPIARVPARFVARPLYREDFVVAMRRGHAFGRSPTLARYCAMKHLLVSSSGSPRGMIDERLAQEGLTRRVALTVPSFTMALSVIARSDLIGALPRRFATTHAKRFGLGIADLPLRPRFDSIQAITTRAALEDAGIAWLMDRLGSVTATASPSGSRSRSR